MLAGQVAGKLLRNVSRRIEWQMITSMRTSGWSTRMQLMLTLEWLMQHGKKFQKKHAQFHVSPRCLSRAGVQYALDRQNSKSIQEQKGKGSHEAGYVKNTVHR